METSTKWLTSTNAIAGVGAGVPTHLANRKNWPRVIYVIGLLLCIEVALQMFYWVTTGSLLYVRDKPPIWAADSVSGWTNRPSFSYRHMTPEFAVDLHTNSQGFRVSALGEEYLRMKPPGTFRILLLGPSFAYGWGVNFEDTFGVQLQRILEKSQFASGRSIEVLNHGVPALPAANQLEWFRQIGKDYSPDLVIHFVYGSLEVSSQTDRSITVTDGGLRPLDASAADFMWGYAKNSAAVFYTGVLVTQLAKSAGIDRRGGCIEGAGREICATTLFDAYSTTVRESTAFYRTFKQVAQESGADFLAVHFPLAYVIYPEDRTRWALQGVENIDAQVVFNTEFAAHLKKQAVPCLNLTESLVEYAKQEQERLYYWLDVHWTPLGNRRSAELVGQYLERERRGSAFRSHDFQRSISER